MISKYLKNDRYVLFLRRYVGFYSYVYKSSGILFHLYQQIYKSMKLKLLLNNLIKCIFKFACQNRHKCKRRKKITKTCFQ
jgi:hypothetical protein